MDQKVLEEIKKMQLNEVTEHIIYTLMARRAGGENAKLLAQIASDEAGHADIWKKYTNATPRPNTLKILFYRLCGVLFGLTFVINLMEAGRKRPSFHILRSRNTRRRP